MAKHVVPAVVAVRHPQCRLQTSSITDWQNRRTEAAPTFFKHLPPTYPAAGGTPCSHKSLPYATRSARGMLTVLIAVDSAAAQCFDSATLRHRACRTTSEQNVMSEDMDLR